MCSFQGTSVSATTGIGTAASSSSSVTQTSGGTMALINQVSPHNACAPGIKEARVSITACRVFLFAQPPVNVME